MPDRSLAALLILDVLSDFRFPDGAAVMRAARRIVPALVHLRERARRAGVAVIYVNDNPGRWRSDMRSLLEHCTGARARGAEIVSQIAPGPTDYLILKPKHSAFYATPLEVLLTHLGARRLILTGLTSHQCVLFTANDAHVRNFELIVPSDCVAAAATADTRFALRYFESVLRADTRPSMRLRMGALQRPRS